jgi:hypothetical protein
MTHCQSPSAECRRHGTDGLGVAELGGSAPNRARRFQRGLPRPFANPPPMECRSIDNRGKRSWGQGPQMGPAGPRGPLASLGTPAGRALRTVPSKAGEPAFE